MAGRCVKFLGIAVIFAGCVANGSQSKIVIAPTYRDILNGMTELRRKLADMKQKKDLYSEVIKEKIRNDGRMRVPEDLYARSYIKQIVYDVKKSVKEEKKKALEKKLELEEQIENANLDCKALSEIISTSVELKGTLTKRMIEENKKLRASLYRLEERISKEEQKRTFLSMELALELTFNKTPFLTPSVNMYTVEKENDTLRAIIDQKNRRLEDIQQKNGELQSLIYGITNGLLEYKP